LWLKLAFEVYANSGANRIPQGKKAFTQLKPVMFEFAAKRLCGNGAVIIPRLWGKSSQARVAERFD
jgi:hypothetical protein